MDWRSWSRIWSTKSTTTTSRRPPRRSRKNLRWKRMYLLLQADQRLKQNHEDLLLLAHLQEPYLSVKDVELIRTSLTQCQKDWLLFFVMAHDLEKKMVRLNSGDWKIIFGMNLRTLSIGLMKCGRTKWQEAEATRKKFQYCTDSSAQEILYLRALQGHSGRNPIDPPPQDNVLIPDTFFEYIYHIGCAVNLHSITNSGLITGGQNSGREKQTVFFTAVNPMNKEHKDPDVIDLDAPRLAWYKQNLWKKHQDTVYWVDIVLSNKIERNHPLRHTPSLLYPESCCGGIWRNHKTRN